MMMMVMMVMVCLFPGMLSAAASLGMILLWDVDGGLTQIDKYLYSSEDYIKVCFFTLSVCSPASSTFPPLQQDTDTITNTHCVLSLGFSSGRVQSGARLACGIVNSGVRNECDPALALLSDYVLHSSNVMRIGAIFG